MKKLFLIIFIALIYFGVEIQSQNWNALVSLTGVPPAWVGDNERCALFSNKDGIHLLTAKYAPSSGYVYYYKLSTAGQVLAGPITLTSSQGNYPTITGDNNNLYAVYHQGSNLKVHRSTNGGTNWSGNIGFTQTANSCNGVDAAYNSTYGLHVVWSEKVEYFYESYFYRYYNNSWQGNSFNITNTSPIQNGGMPTVALSSNKAHVSVNTGNGASFNDNLGECYSRDFDYSSWSNPISISTNPTYSRVDKIFAKSDYMHAFYYVNADPIVLKYRKKSVNDASWSSEITVDNAVYPTNQTHNLSISQTYDDSIHVCYIRPPYGLATRSILKNGSTFSQLSSVSEGGVSHRDHAVTTTSNDKFFIYSQGDNYYKYRQYDALPLAPQNLTVTAETQSGYAHPKLTWTLNNEPDVYNNTGIAYRIERRFDYNGSGNWTVWSQIATKNGSTSTFIDEGVNGSGNGPNYVQYRLKAQDIGGYQSAYSGLAGIAYGFFDKSSSITNSIKEYELEQNHPNPFNPSTKIAYTLQQDGLASIKIYDVLGTEVATLVNEVKSAGYHEVDFNANNLPSGMYFYKLEAGKFSSVKKMLLVR